MTALLVLWAATPLASGWSWIADICANLVAWGGPPALAVGLWQLSRRRWLGGGLALVAAAVCGLWLLGARAPRAAGEAQVRVVQVNAHTGRGSGGGVMRLLRETDADVVALTEVPRALLEEIRTDAAVAARFPYRDVPPWDLTNTRVLLSRHPATPLVDRAALGRGDERRGLRALRVEHGSGAFVVVQMHPRSPRSAGRWREGNALVRAGLATVAEVGGGEPVVVLADLNSTPTGWRSRELGSAGLLRCKPLGALAGTYPSWGVWPLSVAIDDAWVSGGWGVASWGTVGGLGSDHLGVEVGLSRR